MIKQNKQHNKQNKHTNKQNEHTNKKSKHPNTWLSTPKKARNPGHANHVFNKKTLLRCVESPGLQKTR